MKIETNKAEILSWFEKEDFEGSILLQFYIDQDKETVLLITSYGIEYDPDIHFKFRATEFGDIKRVRRKSPNAKNPRSFAYNFHSGEQTATIELEG